MVIDIRRRTLMAGIASAAFPAARAQGDGAADYPNRPIRMVVAFTPGGGTDIVGRLASKGISDMLGQPVVVDNRPGAGGNIGTEFVARAAPDGYTLVTGGTGSHAINSSLYPKLSFDPIADFSPISLVASTPYLMVVNNSLPVKTLQEFIQYAKAPPRQINMASSSNGGMPHLSGELFKMMTGVKMTHIPYKGTGSIFTDLIAGEVQVLFGDIMATIPHVRSGRLRALGVTSTTRSPILPDVPTISEAGVPGYDSVGWFGVFAPANTPRPIINKLHAALVKYTSLPDVRERFAGLGADVIANTPQQFAVIQKADTARWARVVKESGARLD